MNKPPVITVLFGGVGAEREISLSSGNAIADAFEEAGFEVARCELHEAALPDDLDPAKTVIFPALHGEFGEDGQVQEQMDSLGFSYCGSNSEASRLCMHKAESKALAHRQGIAILEGFSFSAAAPPSPELVIQTCGTSLILKPEDKGSSVGLHLLEGQRDLETALGKLKSGKWILERRVKGRELSIGILQGKGMGLVELIPESGVYDFEAKYSAGKTRYEYPARLPKDLETRAREWAERLFSAAGCRDFGRVDFMLEGETGLFFLEINTLPGLTPTSLLPKSASCLGFSFPKLAKELVRPAIERFSTSVRCS